MTATKPTTASNLPASTLTRSQHSHREPRAIGDYGPRALLWAFLRYDDQCGNGHNSFAITGEIRVPGRCDCEACGMLHDEIAQVFPELAPFLKWHNCSSDGPMHYVANSLYWAGQTKWEKPNLAHFRSTAIWPDATEQDMLTVTEAILLARLPALMAEFKTAMLALGFNY